MKIQRYFNYVWLPLLFGGLFWVGLKQVDTDFGWHVKTGQMIIERGIPKTDPFSYTMPSYPWVDHAWLSDAIWSGWYQISGRWVLACAYALIAIGSILIIVPKNLWKRLNLPLFFGGSVLVLRGGVRSQVVDWLFVSLVIRLSQKELWKKWKWWSVPIFGLWANLHGGFSIGLGVLVTILGIKTLEERKMTFEDVLVWIGCFGATFINPYGADLWREIIMTLEDGGVVKFLGEWLPFYYREETGFWLLAATTVIFGIQGKLKVGKPYLAVLAGFTYAGLATLRHMAFLVIVLVPFAAMGIQKFYQLASKNPISADRWNKLYIFIVFAAFGVFLWETGPALKHLTRSSWLPYPEKAAAYIRRNNLSGQIFSDFGWGGYLIENYSEWKVFADGRMPIWRWPAPEGESEWAFMDYMEITREGNLALLDNYGVNVVLWRNMPENKKEVKTPEWLSRVSSTLQNKKETPEKDFLISLEQHNWKKIYQDGVAVIYVRN